MLATGEEPDTSEVEAAFDKAARWVRKKETFHTGMLADKPIQQLIDATSEYLAKGLENGVQESNVSGAMEASLRESIGVFSGFKTFHEMKEAAGMLLDENGYIKPFNRFLNDVQTINDTYNKNYLKVEYNFTVASSEMAAKWEDLQDDGDGRYLIQYRTAGDNKVRPAHRELNGITLPPSDPFWDSYLPPNGFGCRCTAVKARAAKYKATDSSAAMEAGNKVTNGKYAEMFRFNPGKQRAAYPAYNSYTISKCNVCPKGKMELSKIPSNELCAACPIIRKCARDIAKSQAAIERKHFLREMEPLLKKKVKLLIAGVEKGIGFTKAGNAHLYSDTFGRSSVLKKEDLAGLDRVLQNASYASSSESLSHERKDNIKRFYYLESEINGNTVYLNIAETDEISNKGKVWHKRFLYSITDKIK